MTKEELFEIFEDIDFDDFHKFVLKIYTKATTHDLGPYRKGQYFFNSLYQAFPHVADMIRGEDLDMFYVDSRIMDFMNIVNEFKEIRDAR